MIQPDQAIDDKVIRCMRNSCWIIMAVGTNSICNRHTYFFSTATIVPRTRLNITFTGTLPYCPRTAYVVQINIKINIHSFVFPNEAHGLLCEVRNEYNAAESLFASFEKAPKLGSFRVFFSYF
jgi:hypothetical protein